MYWIKKAVIILAIGCGLAVTTQADPYVFSFGYNDGKLGVIDLATGATSNATRLANGTIVNDIAYSQGELYAIKNTGANLLVLNRHTGAIEVERTVSGASGIQSLAFDSAGALYAATQSTLYRLDPASAAATRIGEFGSAPELGSTGQNIRFAADGNLYISNTESDGHDTDIYRLDTTTGAATWMGEVLVPGLALNNFGATMYGVSMPLLNGATAALWSLDVNSFVPGGTNADGSTHVIDSQMLLGPALGNSFPVNTTFSGGPGGPHALPSPDENGEFSLPEPGVGCLVLIGAALLTRRRQFARLIVKN